MSEWIPEEAWEKIIYVSPRLFGGNNVEVLEYLVFVVKDEAGESEF